MAITNRTPTGDLELTSEECELIADHNAALVQEYEQVYQGSEDPEMREMARALILWRRERARYFSGAAAKAERDEAAEVARQREEG